MSGKVFSESTIVNTSIERVNITLCIPVDRSSNFVFIFFAHFSYPGNIEVGAHATVTLSVLMNLIYALVVDACSSRRVPWLQA